MCVRAAKALSGDGEYYFFSPRDRKYPNGIRPNRAAGSGYWKATGTDKPILAPGGAHCLGVKKALVFYQGRSPKGTKTDWVMHEYRLLDTDAALLLYALTFRLLTRVASTTAVTASPPPAAAVRPCALPLASRTLPCSLLPVSRGATPLPPAGAGCAAPSLLPPRAAAMALGLTGDGDGGGLGG